MDHWHKKITRFLQNAGHNGRFLAAIGVGSAAKGHTDSGRLVAFVFFLRHDSDAAATGVLQDRAVRHEKTLLPSP